MTDRFLDEEVLESLSVEDFRSRSPFPWSCLDRVVRPEGFDRLCEQFPPLSLFEWHEDRERPYGQRPQNRYYLAYNSELQPSYDAPHGSVGLPKQAFPEAWQQFFSELESSPTYARFIGTCLGRSDFLVRYTFHIGVTGSEVCPHLDKGRKLGTHIFYFNTRDDWDPAWGGATLVLAGRRTDRLDPDFDDFSSATPVETLGNRSFIFKNTDEAWHGVQPLACPEGAYRRIFNVVFEEPANPVSRKASPLQRVKRRATAILARR
jgi:hypothetical protein